MGVQHGLCLTIFRFFKAEILKMKRSVKNYSSISKLEN